MKLKKQIMSIVGNSTLKTNIGISNDRTKAERDYFKEVLTNFNNRKAQGENNIALKYVKGVPKIIPLRDAGVPVTPNSVNVPISGSH